MAAVGELDRRAPLGLVFREVRGRHDALVGLHLRHDRGRRGALVEALRAPRGDALEHGRELGVLPRGAERGWLSARQKERRGGGVLLQALGRLLDGLDERRVHDKPVAGQRDRGRHDLGPGQLLGAEDPVELGEAGHAARDAGGQDALARGPGGLAARVEVHVAARGLRRGLSKIQRFQVFVTESRHREAPAAEVPGGGVRDRERERRRDRGVGRVASASEHVAPDLRGQRVVRHDHPLGAPHGGG